MKWKEVKQVCKKYGIVLGYDGIRYSQIPKVKEYFTRRPKYKVFEYSKTANKCDTDNLPAYERWAYGAGRNTAPMFYNRPRDLSELSDWQIDDFISKGFMPSRNYCGWYCDQVPIHNEKELENAIKDLFTRLEIVRKVNNSKDLKDISTIYQKKSEEIETLQKQLNTLKTKYREYFKKQTSIISEFE